MFDWSHRRHDAGSKRLTIAGSIICLVIMLWIYAMPYVTLYRIDVAAESGDTQTLETLIDFPAFRESVKEALQAKVGPKLGSIPEIKPLTALGQRLTGRVINLLVNLFVSPRGIAALMAGKQPTADEQPSHGDKEEDAYEKQFEYRGLSAFEARIRNRKGDGTTIVLILCRQSLSWRLCRLRLE